MEASSDASISTWSCQDTPKLWDRTLREEPDITGAGILRRNGCEKEQASTPQQKPRTPKLQHLGMAPGPTLWRLRPP
eukprot:2992226-Amphidinium_carterae.2